MKLSTSLGAALFFSLLMALPSGAQNVIINEIMYHPASTNLLQQWVELLNTGSNSVDLSGWTLGGGADFTFSNATTLGAGRYLVVAADRATFTNRYPSVTNFVAGWVGDLSSTIKLSDTNGNTVNSVQFFSDGDWAVRLLGLNGVVGALDSFGGLGWESFARHDGLGFSLELINPNLPNTYAHNWGSSAIGNGTPGRTNSITRTNVAPFIAEVSHAPVVPQPADPVTITARIVDERTNGLTVTLNYRVDGAAGFTQTAMMDDGTHGDGLAADGIYGAILSAQPQGTIIEFFLQARDLENNLRTYPLYTATNTTRTANLLYQVDNGVYGGAQPVYRIIMTEQERAYLQDLSDNQNGTTTDSDANMNATWITTDGVVTDGTTTQLRYNTGVRNRGHGSRLANPHNYHLNIPSDRAWKKQSGINLNSQYAHSQFLGSAIFRRLEMPMADSRAVQVRVNGVNLMAGGAGNSFGSYAANEQYNNDFIKRSFPLDSHGNSYRGIRDPATGVSSDADFSWQGANIHIAAYTNAYFKQNNSVQDDWSDLIDLLAVLNSANGHLAANYIADVRQRLNVEQWMKYMAVNVLLDNDETCPANGNGDDYALYRGTNDTRFLLLSYDMDTVMGRGLTPTPPGHSIWRMTNLPVIDRFMKTPQFAPIYFAQLKTLAETAFAPAQMNPLLDQLFTGFLPAANIADFKAFNAAQLNVVLAQIPLALTASSPLAVQNGYPHSTIATATLNGTANAVDTRTVLINGAAATWSAWQGTWTISNVLLRPGINRILVQCLNSNSVEFARTTIDIWYDDASVSNVSGTLAANTIWSPAAGPYNVTANLIVPAGITLIIQAGTTVYVAAGVTITVNGTGKILAQGADTNRIHIGRNPAAAGNWGSLDFINTTVESRLAYVDFDSCGGTTTADGHNAQVHVNGGSIVFLDHCTWPPTPVVGYISFNGSSFIVQNCTFPTYPAPTGPESLHGVNGIPAGGYGIFRDNYFGHTWGFNDTIDFTGGNRPGAILQIINNVFDGASDDCLDLDSTDAWIEGNIFMHVHRDPTRVDQAIDTGSAISGGVDTVGQNPDWTIVNNLFYDVDHVFLNKGNSTSTGDGGGRVAFLYNTVAHVARENSGSTAAEIATFDWSDDNIVLPDLSIGSGLYAAHNIIYDAAALHRFYDPAHLTVIMDNNILPVEFKGTTNEWTGPGTGNRYIDPRLNLGALAGTPVANVTAAQLRQAFQLRPGSPAAGAGFGGRNIGGVNSNSIAIAGEPSATTTITNATLTVGPGGTFNWGTNAPQAWGWKAFKWKLDGGALSAEIPVVNNPPFTTPATITLSNLGNGPHTVFVTGKNDAGYYQDDVFVYPTNAGVAAHLTASRTWTVNTGFSRLILNEILAKNNATFTNGGGTPDLIELYNDSAVARDLTGLGLTDDPADKYKFFFPAGTIIGARQFLVVFADNDVAAPGLHLGFGLNQDGDSLFLYDLVANGGTALDSITFGLQLPDFSIGRLASGAWGLCKPTFGTTNLAALTGDPLKLKINEWLADAQFAANNDFIELYNPDALPVPLGGLFLSDAAGAPNKNPIAALSFIAAAGFTSFIADSDPQQGANHLNFKLSPDVGLILLSAADLSTIDAINYGPQHTDVSQGRSPNGSVTLTTFALTTPGAGNPGTQQGDCTLSTVTVPLLPMNATWRFNETSNFDGVTWYATNYNDSSWPTGPGLLAVEDCGCLPAPGIGTPLTIGRNTYYFRTRFLVNTNLAGFNLNITMVMDDGAIVYLNGTRVLTNGMSTGTPAYATFASRTVPDAVSEFFTVPSTALVQGTNVLAVEVHQASLNSSDIVLGLALDASRTSTNCTPGSVVNVVLNEVLANNHSLTNFNGATADFVELYNLGTNAVDLTDASLTDDSEFARKFVFPAGPPLAAGAYRVIYFDGDQPVSATNTGFGLPAGGGTVFFFNKPASGGSLIDAIRFGLQTPDLSIARLPNGTGNWNLAVPTRGTPNVAAGLGSVASLRINEWMADPAGGNDWFEVYNSAVQPVPLGGLYLTDNLTDKTQSPVQPLSFIGVGANAFVQFIADGNPGAGADHVSFSLKKSGESLGIFSPVGSMLNGLGFGAQATGVSQGRLPDGGATIVSFATTPSPAEANYLPLTNAIINEVLTHTDPPLEDAIEIYNPTTAPASIGGFYLSNSKDNFKKYRIPDGTSIPAGSYAVFYETQFNVGAAAFTLNSAHGDQVHLSRADAVGNLLGFRSLVSFGAGGNGVSFGRYQTSVGVDFTALRGRTFGQDAPTNVAQFRIGAGLPNEYPKVGPVVINELMYHPVTVNGTNITENPDDEYIELCNLTAGPVPLFDPAYPTNTWRLRDAVDFDFPTNITLAANGYILVVPFYPTNAALLAAFRTKYGVSNSVPVYGPFAGRLDNGGDNVELYLPDTPQGPGHPDVGFVPFILVDKVNYDDKAPWPTNADGTGLSLQRKVGTLYANEPLNWQAAAPTAGRTNPPGFVDVDGDGMADDWELLYGLKPTTATDGSIDSDGDGQTNLQEYLAGTDPLDPASFLKIQSASISGNTCTFDFIAAAGRTYTVQYRESLTSGSWLGLTNVNAQAVTGLFPVNDGGVGTNSMRFYRIVAPAQ